MRRPLHQIRDLAKKYKAPVICAGDIFHTWKSLPELVNFALEELPDVYAIPGQHDLPFHQSGGIERSAYWTLVEAGKITNLELMRFQILDKGLFLHGFPYGSPLGLPEPFGILKLNKKKGETHLAICHKYVWRKGHTFPNAPKDGHVSEVRRALKNFDAVVCGDNHSGFLDATAKPHIFNCGSMMRRNSDQVDYQPHVGLLHDDGTFTQMPLDISKDKLIKTVGKEESEELNALPFIELLQEGMTNDLDLAIALKRYGEVHKVNHRVRKIINEIIETIRT